VMVVSATHAHPMVTPHATMASFDEFELLSNEEGLRLRMVADVEAL
jgi:hypothetical protein